MSSIILPKPTLLLGCGISGSGKSTILKPVVSLVQNAFWVDKDALNQAFMGEGGIYDDFYHAHVRDQSYAYMLRLAKDNVELGNRPVVEGNYNKEIQSGYLDDVVFPMFDGCAVKLVYCWAPEDVIRERLIRRVSEADEAVRASDLPKLESDTAWAQYIQKQPPLPPELEKYAHVKIDTTKPVEVCVQEVIAYLTQ